MSKNQANTNSLMTLMKKFFLSFFVVFTFLAYVVHERFIAPAQADNSGDGGASSPSNGAETLPVNDNEAVSTAVPTRDNAPKPIQSDAVSVSVTATATDVPTPQPVSGVAGTYKDGTYTGTEADAYYGLVQVQAIIQNGKIATVSFLEYPNHRRTSVQINSQVMPWLQQEAIQAQSAQVDLISGATLTSQAFAESLQAALNLATN